jgi:hypothetical protein
MSFDDRVAISKLKDTPDDQLGKAYAQAQVRSLTSLIARFTDESAHGTDAEFMAFAGSNLPLLQKQLERAQIVVGGGDVQ